MGALRAVVDRVARRVTAAVTLFAVLVVAAAIALDVPKVERLSDASRLANRLIGSNQIRDNSILLRDLKRGQLESKYLTISGAAAKYVRISSAAARHLTAAGPPFLKVADAETTYLKLDAAATEYLKLDAASTTYLKLSEAAEQ